MRSHFAPLLIPGGLSVRPEWLYSIVRDAQVFACRFLDGTVEPHELFDFLRELPPPLTRLEKLLMRGLGGELWDQVDTQSKSNPATRPFAHESAARDARFLLETEYYKPWTVRVLARHVRCNRTTLGAAFKRLTGVSIHHFLISQRVRAAEELLGSSDQPIKMIAVAVGYSGIANFYRSFERLTRLTPRQYRDHFSASTS